MPAIWLVSFVLLMTESGYAESGSSEPLWLRISATIVFPPGCLFALIDHWPLPDRIVTMILFPVLFLNSFLWAFLFVYLCRFVARFVRRNKRGLHDAA